MALPAALSPELQALIRTMVAQETTALRQQLTGAQESLGAAQESIMSLQEQLAAASVQDSDEESVRSSRASMNSANMRVDPPAPTHMSLRSSTSRAGHRRAASEPPEALPTSPRRTTTRPSAALRASTTAALRASTSTAPPRRRRQSPLPEESDMEEEEAVDEGDLEDSPPRRRRARQTSEPPPQTLLSSPAGTPTARRIGRLNRVKKAEVDESLSPLKKALEATYRLLANLPSGSEPPRTAAADVMARVLHRFEGVEGESLDESSPSLISPLQVACRNLRSSHAASSLSNPQLIALLADQRTVEGWSLILARYGLDTLRVDYLSDPYSRFNLVVRNCFLDCLDWAAARHAYARTGRVVVDNIEIIGKLFDSFVFGYLGERYRRETKEEGGCREDAESNAANKRVSRLAAARRGVILNSDYGIPKRFAAVCINACTSDDDEAPDKKSRFIRRKPERDPSLTLFFRYLDKLHSPNSKARVDIADSKESRWSVLGAGGRLNIKPSDQVPLDYYNIDWFNAQPLPLRRKLLTRAGSVEEPDILFSRDIASTGAGVALTAREIQLLDKEMHIKAKVLTAQFAPARRLKYHLPGGGSSGSEEAEEDLMNVDFDVDDPFADQDPFANSFGNSSDIAQSRRDFARKRQRRLDDVDGHRSA